MRRPVVRAPRRALLAAALALLGARAAPALEPAPPGTTRWVEGEAGPDAPWSDAVAVEAPLVLLELRGADGADVDVAAAGPDGARRRAAGHGPRERLLVAGGGRVALEVLAATRARFRLGVTALRPGDAGPGVRVLRVDAAARAVVVEGPRPADDAWAVVAWGDDLAPRALGVRRGAGARCRTPPGTAWVTVEGLAGAPREVRPGKGVRSPPPGPLDAFLAGLTTTPAQARALAALRTHPDFLAIEAYLEATRPPLRLRAVPGLRVAGVERFGAYGGGTLTINPAIAGHRDNPQELVDTLVHELIHALLDLPRGPGFPLGPDVLDVPHDPRLAALDAPMPLQRGRLPEPWLSYLEREYGPSASAPARDYSDINRGAQRLVLKVTEDTLARSGAGGPTLLMEGVRAR